MCCTLLEPLYGGSSLLSHGRTRGSLHVHSAHKHINFCPSGKETFHIPPPCPHFASPLSHFIEAGWIAIIPLSSFTATTHLPHVTNKTMIALTLTFPHSNQKFLLNLGLGAGLVVRQALKAPTSHDMPLMLSCSQLHRPAYTSHSPLIPVPARYRWPL